MSATNASAGPHSGTVSGVIDDASAELAVPYSRAPKIAAVIPAV
jgi:hypothetical protein